jgi:low affinity Fe/Cu permease
MTIDMEVIGGAMAVIICLGVLVLFMIQRHLRDLHMTMNSRLDELVRTTKALARQEGFEAGKREHLEAIRQAGDATGQHS